MNNRWPEYVTKDLGDTTADDLERVRRWEQYDREMRALIAKGGVEQDKEGWWVDIASGELIGPDPEIERPLTDDEVAQLRPFSEVFPDLAESINRGPGRPPLESPKQQVTLRLDANVLERLRASGKGWQSRVNDVLKKTVGL